MRVELTVYEGMVWAEPKLMHGVLGEHWLMGAWCVLWWRLY